MALFTQIPYALQTLINNIDSGILALPEIQRPFVWENAKVRDLFDSMYRGYPVGTLLFWLTSANTHAGRSIAHGQPTIPHSLIVDGQQRLTGLYAVIKGKPVLRNNYEYENIHIAFNPLTGEFMIPDASTPRNPEWHPDISVIWKPDADLFSIVPEYLSRYKELRGEDSLSAERRDEQFSHLKDAQRKVLDLANWFDFLTCLTQAGYRRENQIISRTAAVYGYAFYLIGKHDFGVKHAALRRVSSRWFFACSLTARYSSSPESDMEKDLAALRGRNTPEQFVGYLEEQMALTLTPDYWTITLPGKMATSAARSPELAAYFASLNLLNANVLFSKVKVASLMDPGLQPGKALLDRHHLFPKGYLKKRGITAVRQTNQIANMALLEWPQNILISDDAPYEYVPRIREQGLFSYEDWTNFSTWHALPDNWEHMEYEDFLAAWRAAMAEIIREGFEHI